VAAMDLLYEKILRERTDAGSVTPPTPAPQRVIKFKS
jgi:hypothetical protein